MRTSSVQTVAFLQKDMQEVQEIGPERETAAGCLGEAFEVKFLKA